MIQKNSFRLLFTAILIITITSLSSCSSSDDSPPDSTDDSGMDGSDDTAGDGTDDTSSADTYFVSRFIEREVDGSLLADVVFSYNDANQLIESAPRLNPSAKTFYVYEGNLITQVDFINTIDGERLTRNRFFYDSLGRLVKWYAYFEDNVTDVFTLEYDDLDRLIERKRYNGIEAYDNDEITIGLRYSYDGDARDFIDRTFVNYNPDGTITELSRTKVTQYSDFENTLFFGESVEHLPKNRILSTLIAVDFYNFSKYILESYTVNLDTGELLVLINHVVLSLDENNNVVGATVKYYPESGTGIPYRDRTYEFEYELR